MRQLGDEALLIDVAGGYRAAQELARTLRARDVIPAAETVGVVGAFEVLPVSPAPTEPTCHVLPVVFDGEDLPGLGCDPAALAGTFASLELEVAYRGFMPGFAYLVGLPEPLASLPRRPSPRPRVPAGSLAVGGGFAGFYPGSSPGGWNLLGRTNVRLFDPARPPYALLAPGDRVRFSPVDWLPPLEPLARPALRGEGLEVLDPGPLLLVQDRGREGVAALGVPRGGAFNQCWARIANAAVGNEEGAPLLETAGLLRLRAERDCLVAVAGETALRVDGRERPAATVAHVARGQEIALGSLRHGRAYLAFDGGLATPRLFGSASSDAVSGLPPGPLRAGDRLALGLPVGRARLRFSLPKTARPTTLRVIEGPDEVGRDALAGTFTIDPLSDRTGVRLRSARPGPARPAIASHAVVPGSVQLPPGGDPIVLGPDCGPIGGYPVAGTVITADLWRLATLGPGDAVSFRSVSPAEAELARAELSRLVSESLSGWFPTAFA